MPDSSWFIPGASIHEFIITLKRAERNSASPRWFAKRLLDHGFIARDHLFPVAGTRDAFWWEPTETRQWMRWTDSSGDEKDQSEAENTPDVVKTAPKQPAGRAVDDVRAARELDLRWNQGS